MSLNERRMKRILEKYKQMFVELEHYDRTREILWARKRIDLTLSQRTINKLKKIKVKTGKPVSHIVEEAINNLS
jgi:hypothetical protein